MRQIFNCHMETEFLNHFYMPRHFPVIYIYKDKQLIRTTAINSVIQLIQIVLVENDLDIDHHET